MKKCIIEGLRNFKKCRESKKQDDKSSDDDKILEKLALTEVVLIGKVFLRLSYTFQSDVPFLNAVIEILNVLSTYKIFECGVSNLKYLYFLMIFSFFCAVNPDAVFQRVKKPKQVEQSEGPFEMEEVKNDIKLDNNFLNNIKQCK